MKYLAALVLLALTAPALADIVVQNNCEAGELILQEVSNGASCLAANSNEAPLSIAVPKGVKSVSATPNSSYCLYLQTQSTSLGAKPCKVSGNGNVSFNPGSGMSPECNCSG